MASNSQTEVAKPGIQRARAGSIPRAATGILDSENRATIKIFKFGAEGEEAKPYYTVESER